MMTTCNTQSWWTDESAKPPSVLAATEEYFSDQDLFAHWLSDECDCDPGNTNKSETSGRLFKSWKEYAIAAGNSPGSQQSFKDQMIRHGFRFYRSNRAREFFGIMLRQKVNFHDGE